MYLRWNSRLLEIHHPKDTSRKFKLNGIVRNAKIFFKKEQNHKKIKLYERRLI